MIDRKIFEKMTLDEKKELIEKILISYPKFNEIIAKIDYCRSYSKISVEPEGMLITGEPGSGKTTICRFYAAKHPPCQTEFGTICPVIYVTIPVPATVKALATSLLAALGDPLPLQGSVVTQTKRLEKLIEKCAVEVILLDEFQHFIERDSLKILQTISDWLKNLMNVTKKPLILFGMPKATDVLNARTNQQLRRRFPYQKTLAAFGWKKTAEKREFQQFLYIVDEQLPFPESSNLADPRTAAKIHSATKGQIHFLMKLIRRAAFLSLENIKVRVDSESLRQAFVEKLAGFDPTLKNPFK